MSTPGAGNLPQKHVCKNIKTFTDALTVNITTMSPTTKTVDSKKEDDGKINVAVIVIIPVGVVLMCGILVFICRKGGTQGHASIYGKPQKNQQTPQQGKNILATRQISQDNKLHRQVSLLRQKSKQSGNSEELAEDIEGEEAAMNGEA